MKSGKIKISRFTEGLTVFKPDYYLNRGKKVISDLLDKGIENANLVDLTDKLYQGGIFKRVFVENKDYAHQYITASDMVKTQPLDSAKNISIKYTPWIDEMTLKEKQILISCAGTVGKTSLVNDSFSGCIGSQEIIRIETSKVPYGFLYAYLSSPIVNEYIHSMIYGAVVPRISPGELGRLPVLLPSESKQKQIHNLIVEAANLRGEANNLLSHAVELVNKGFNTKLDSKSKTGISSIKDLLTNYQKRLNSPAYIYPGVSTIKKLKDDGFVFQLLNSLNFKVTRPGIFKRIKVKGNNGLPYLKGSELNKMNPFNSCEFLSKTRTPFLEELKLRENQILFTCAGTVGDLKLISKEFEERFSIGSQDIIRIEATSSNLSIYYLFAYLKSDIIQNYIQSLKYGSVIERVEPFHIEMIPVWISEKEIMNKIIVNVEKYKNLFYEAFKMEEEAINLIENEIESWQTS